MNYSRLQKWLSSFLIFSILFLQTFEVPMLSSTRAEAKTNADIVSFIIDEDIYGGSVKTKVLQYAKDIQAYLPNTRVVIFPVQKTTNPFTIASINEKLFYEGDGESGLSRLIGTILIGEVPLPVVHKEGKAFMSVYPYVDFNDKSFVYDQTKKSYEYTSKLLTSEKPEIWHSVIRPNTGDVTKDESELLTFLDKTHDFYSKQGLFSSENTPQEPRVFYMDTFHDQETSSPDAWQAYNLYLDNIEDISYRRFNKYLAKKFYDVSQGIYGIDKNTVSDPGIKSILEANASATMDLANSPDITTKDIVEKSVKQFFEVLNAKYMGDVLRFVHNAGRYGNTTNVRADSVPVMIAKKDLFMRTALKDVNTSLEGAIDATVQNTLAEALKIATSYRIDTTYYDNGVNADASNALQARTGLRAYTSKREYKNYFFGKEASTVTDADQCTIVRGSTLKVESNRGYNIKNVEGDVNALKAESAQMCFGGGAPAVTSYWGGNSPLNFDQNGMKTGKITLKPHTYKDFVKPIYDAKGSRELEVSSPLHLGTPKDCLENNMLQQPYADPTGSDTQWFFLPSASVWPYETMGKSFSCITAFPPSLPGADYYTILKKLQTPPFEDCTITTLELDGVQKISVGKLCDETTAEANYQKVYSFKTLSKSIMEHKSPTDEEYGLQLQEMVTPSLPSDRDRYVDFLDKNLAYKKVVYPNFFRIVLSGTELNYPGANQKIKDLLDAKSAEIQGLGGSIDLYALLSADQKALNAAIEGVLWNNMRNATLKYSNTLERSLDRDGEDTISANGKKNDYEIAYLGAPGDAKNMYLKVDPEAKSPPPKEVSDIMDRVNTYRGLNDGTNISQVPKETMFKCGPPEGVPIWEWLPAIFCWLGTILPPTISAGSCGGSSLTQASSTTFASPANALDANRNGVLDGYELIGSPSGALNLRSPSQIFGYGQTIPLEAELTKDGQIIDIDSFNRVSFDIKKLTVVSPDKNIAPKVVYDRAGNEVTSNIDSINEYINFKPLSILAQNGLAKYSFSSKNEDIDAIFDAHILTKDRYGKVIVDKTSNEVKISIRSERISAQSKVKTGESPFAFGSVIAAGNSNGILFNLKKVNKAELAISDALPYTLNIYDDISQKRILGPIPVSKNEYLFRDASVLNKSGVYRFEFVDSKGIKGFSTITVLPALPVKIEVTPASNTFIAGEKTTVLVRVLDEFGNIAQGETYKLDGSISGGGGFVRNDGKEPTSNLSKNIIEGYASFDVTNPKPSNEMKLSFNIEMKTGNISSEYVTLHSIDFAKISLNVEGRDNIVAGRDKHKISIKVLDKNNQVLTGYNGIVSLDFPKLSGTISTPFVRIGSGVSEGDIFLTPAYVAEKNIRIQAQVPGISTIEGDTVTILPDVPMSFAFVKKDDRMEAKVGNTDNTRATLYDRYGNVAYNTTGYTLALSIPDDYAKYATLPGGLNYSFTNGSLDFDIAATPLPGRAYIIGKVTPGLEGNTFTVTDKSNKTLTITGVSENVTTLDTYYLFNKSKLDAMKYDAQYSVLLGGEYGDITTPEYLGGEILFNHGSKSLAVTTLLNNPWKAQDLFGFTPAGKYNYVEKTDDTSSLQTTVSDNGTQSFIAFYDSYRKEYIARAWLNIDPSRTSYIPCKSSGTDISNCELAPQTTVFLKGFDGNTSAGENGGLVLYSPSKIPLLRINTNGKMEKYPGIEMELDDKVTSNLLGINLLSNGAQVGYLGIKFASDTIVAVPSSQLSGALSSRKNAIVMESLSNRYSPHKTYLGVSSRGSQGIMFAFNDISTNDIGELDPAYTAKSGPIGLEDYPKKTGIGWEDTNRSLLEVAAGTTIGNATKFYQTFSTITLGDAVSHLPKLTLSSNFDHTIGTQISVGNGEQIESYKKIDINGDTVPDMVIFYESGKIQLLINYAGSFKDMGYLAYVTDAGKGRKGVGNFFGDKYDDIILTDAKGKLVLLDNVSGKLTRSPLIIINTSGVPEDIHGQIQQMEIFDMDADGKDDIVTMDDSGEINILYGTVRNTAGKEEHIFTKKLIESGFGMRLSKEVRHDGGAFSYAGLTFPKSVALAPESMSATGEVNQDMVNNIIYYQFEYQSPNETKTPEEKKESALRAAVGTDISDSSANNTELATKISQGIEDIRTLAGPGNTDFTALDNSDRGTNTANNKRTFIRSAVAEGKGLTVDKTYTIMSTGLRDTIQGGDKVRVEITLTNTGSKAFKDAVYLDSNDQKLFTQDQDGNYTIERNGGKEEKRPLKYMTNGDFDYGFDLGTMAPRDTIKIRYIITANTIAFGKMNVGLLEKGEAGDDKYGDITLSPSNMCGGELIMWRSVEPFSPLARNYEKGTKKFTDNSKLPEELAKNSIDVDKNGIPDYVDDLIASGKGDVSLLKNYAQTELGKYNKDSNGNQIPDRGDSKGSRVVSYDESTGKIEINGLNSVNVDAINSGIDEVVRGLGCGLGGGGCINSPVNWAPLAPGSAPVLMGFPLAPLTPASGIPIFSALTAAPMPTWPPGMCTHVPATWPPVPYGPSPLSAALFAYAPCGAVESLGPLAFNAGGYLGTTGVMNSFRLFITPTITGAVGTAACFGPLPIITGNIPPPGISPFIPGGGCIVAAMPLMSCNDDGSDGDAGSLGLGTDSNNSYVNADACVKGTEKKALLPEDRRNLISYVAGNSARLPEINASMARGGLSSLSAGPLVGIGMGGGGESDFEVGIDAVALANFDLGNIVKIKNTRVSAFPDFLMEWVTRQMEEVVNKLTSLPTLYIILPDFSGFHLSDFKDFPKNVAGGFRDAKSDGYADSLKVDPASSSGLGGAKSKFNGLVEDHSDTINAIGKNVSGIKAAYGFMSRLPLIKLENEMVDISLPWISFEEMEKWLAEAKLTKKQWETEFDDKKTKWAKLGTLSGVDQKVIADTSGLISSLQENIQIIEEYKRFPEKLQKYLTWKERYASQLLCNIEAIEFMMGGWIGENGKRFHTWVELYVLIKAILKAWQTIPDLFKGYEAECSTCNNERYDLKHFIFKLISAIIPKIPIIQFPKWPDIWLDLHNIRGGLNILLPEFHFNFVPMVLPQLPRLYLPDVPTVNIGLPSLPILPRIPDLPDLPDLPSLPNIKLPDLPPPPTIPKLFGGIAVVLNILKIVRKILCIMRMNPFVPEWRAGDQIAQITERQGTFSLDFLNIEFPNFSLSFVDAIKVTTYVNLEMDIDFITAMAKATLDPLNKFTNDFSNLGGTLIPDVDLRGPIPSNINIPLGKKQGYTPTKNDIMAALLKKLSFDVVHNFVTLNTYMKEHANDTVSVAGLRDILTENVAMIRATHDPKLLSIADNLEKAVNYRGENETKFVQELTKENTEKFGLLKDYVKGELSETLRLKTDIDTMLRTGIMNRETIPAILSIGGENIKIQSFTTDNPERESLRKKILATNDRILPSMESILNGERDPEIDEIQNMGKSLSKEVTAGLQSWARDLQKNDEIHALAYADSSSKLLSINDNESSATINNLSSSVASSVSAPTATVADNASSYKYEGIYILDKNNKQVRLFDYTDGVDGKEELVYTDVDKDGDDDIIYRMDNSLYLKENFLKDPTVSHFTDEPKVVPDWQDFLHIDNETSRILAAPNHFEETFVTSGEIDFSFRPANFSKDNLFRFEYYDYIDRFDKINSGETPRDIRPETPLHSVDLIPELLGETVVDTTQTGFVGRKNIVSFGRGSGEATVTMNAYQAITSETNGTSPIIISEGRTIYTDDGGAVISYLRDGETEVKTLTFAKHTNYEFLKNTKIWVKSGTLYLFRESQEQKTLEVSRLYGMPIPAKTKVEIASKTSYLEFNYYDKSSSRLDGPGTYKYYPLGKKSVEYNVSLSTPNEWYYARLFSLDRNIRSTIASLHLLSPQKEADSEGPLITFGDVIRIPVYQKQILNLKPYIEDISGVDNVWVDMDLSKDTDGDGDAANDKDSLDPSSIYGVKKGSTLFHLEIGPFDTLFTKKVRLFTEDGVGNVSSRDLVFTVYPPIPEIRSLTGGKVSGDLSEVLKDEPVDIFRLRNNILTRIPPTELDTAKTSDNGTFSFMTNATKGIVLTQSGRTIANIDERTGKIELEDNTSFHIAVIPATSQGGPMQIQVQDSSNKPVFSEKINISPTSYIEGVSDFDLATGTGIFITTNNGFRFAKNTLSTQNLALEGYITDADYNAIADIAKGGDIYIRDTKYKLSYTTKDSSIVIRLQDSNGVAVANILYKIDAEYIIK